MNAMARVGMLSVLWAASAGAADLYALREDVPETGSNIQKAAVYWRVPIDKRYEELSSGEKQLVRDEYVRLGARDEPPYPRDGMTPILADVARIQLRNLSTGPVHLAVRVDARGEPQGVAVLKSSDRAVDQAVAYTLMHTRYKPAMCDGAPCAADYSFRYTFENPHTRNFIVDWHPNLWMAPQKRD
jgi:hypothetical protein